MRILLLFLFSLLFLSVNAQTINVLDFEVIDQDTIFFSKLPEVEILAFKSKEDKNAYYILKRRVLKVYPYALIAKKKLDEIKSNLENIPKR